MPRALAPGEALAPLIEAAPEVVAAIEAYLTATAVADATPYSPGSRTEMAYGRARDELETMLLRLPRAWHVHRGSAWGVQKRRKFGPDELTRRDPGTIRQAPRDGG